MLARGGGGGGGQAHIHVIYVPSVKNVCMYVLMYDYIYVFMY